ncbi:MAG: redox-regulated ATPase YchF [Acidobacteria bacterium]|nr:redox-regulated ATPase YchF [Acidobacteriota bacterium]
MKIGIIGLKQSGKTTIFNALTGQAAQTGYGANKLEVNMGTVQVPDQRLDKLTEIFIPKRQVNAVVEYVDVAGVEGEKAVDPALLNQIKVTDALLVVIRAFESDAVVHPFGSVDPIRDFQSLMDEFLLSDQAIAETRISRIEKVVKSNKNAPEKKEYDLLQRIIAHLEEMKPLREMELKDEERKLIRGFQFLTQKPILLVFNTGEGDEASELLSRFREASAGMKHIDAIAVSGEIEMEVSQLSPDEQPMFMEDLGLEALAKDRVIQASYSLLGYISFFTAGEDECRAWTIRNGTVARKAAGEIHSDIERGFIRAEVVHYDDFIALGTMAKCKEEGKLRLEGKEYVVRDGDIINFRFNV